MPEDSCCGGAHRIMYKKDASGKTVRVEVEEADMVKVPVEWTGFRVGSFSVFGAVTKTQYRFGSFQRVQEVYEDDLEGVLQQKDFHLLNGSPTVVERPRRGMPPNIDAPIGPTRQMSDAERAARAATATQAQQPLTVPKGVGAAEDSLRRGPGRPRKDGQSSQTQQRMKPMRDTRGTSRVDPRQFGL